MKSRQNGKKLIMFGVGLMILVIGGGFLLSHQGGGSPQTTASAQTTAPMVVAAQTIPAGTVFKTGESLRTFFSVKQAPVSLVPFGAYTDVKQLASLEQSSSCGTNRPAGCQGQVTVSETIFQNTPVVAGMFSTLGQFREGVSSSFAIPYGYVGIAVSFDAANSVIGSIAPGDDVDLAATYKGPNINTSQQGGATQFGLNDIRVISVNGPPPANAGSPTGAPGAPAPSASASAAGGTLVLLVRYQEALIIQHLKDVGEHWQMSVVLRSAKEADIKHFKTMTVNDNWFFRKQSNPFKNRPGY